MGRSGKVISHVVFSGLAFWLGQDVTACGCDEQNCEVSRARLAIVAAELAGGPVITSDDHGLGGGHNGCSVITRLADFFPKKHLPGDLGEFGDSSSRVSVFRLNSIPFPSNQTTGQMVDARTTWHGPESGRNLYVADFNADSVGRRFVISTPLRGPPLA